MKIYSIVFFLLCIAIASPAYAQDSASQIDETLLKALYQQQLEYPEDEYIQQRIAEARGDIRDRIEEELQKIVAIPDEEQEIDAEEFSKALDRQRKVILALQERLRDRQVDLSILLEEEERLYVSGNNGSGNISSEDLEKVSITKSYEGLLAKKAILDERITVLKGFISQQQSRLQILEAEQRQLRFQIYYRFARYAAIVLAIAIVERLIRRLLLSRISNNDRRYALTKLFTTFIYGVLFLGMTIILLSEYPGFLASFAIVGAGIAIALQDIVKDIFGWIMIYQQRLYSTGDRISIANYTGEVIDVDVFRTKLLEVGIPPEGVLEHTGKILSLPNSLALNSSITNHSSTSDYVNAEMSLIFTFESNWKKAKNILIESLNIHTAEFTEKDKKQQKYRARMLYINRQIIGPMVYTDIADDGVKFIMRFSVPIGGRRGIVDALAEDILAKIDNENDIELAYKTTRYYKKGE